MQCLFDSYKISKTYIYNLFTEFSWSLLISLLTLAANHCHVFLDYLIWEFKQ